MRQAVQQIIYDEVISAVLKIIDRLNLSSKTQLHSDDKVCHINCMHVTLCSFVTVTLLCSLLQSLFLRNQDYLSTYSP